MRLTSSSLMTGESRSLLSSPSISTSSSCFSHPNTFTSSLSVDELPLPPPGSVVGVVDFEGDSAACPAFVVFAVDDDDMARSGDLDTFVDDDLIDRSSVAIDDADKSVLLG